MLSKNQRSVMWPMLFSDGCPTHSNSCSSKLKITADIYLFTTLTWLKKFSSEFSVKILDPRIKPLMSISTDAGTSNLVN